MHKIITSFLLLIPFTALSAQFSLTVEIVKLDNNKGVVIVDLLDKEEKSLKDKTLEISNLSCVVVFDSLRQDLYAIRYFHDENQNEELDTNFMGIPKEGFGFSNDAIGKFGPKDFSEWLIEVSCDTTVRLTTNYMFRGKKE